MVYKKYVVELKEEEKTQLKHFVSTGKRSVRALRRAHILLLSDRGKTDDEIADIMDVSSRTVGRIRKRYVTSGLERALHDKPRPGQPKKLSSAQEAQIIAIACSDPPEGRKRWTLELLREEAMERGIVEEISTEPIRILLKEHDLKPWEKNVVHPRING